MLGYPPKIGEACCPPERSPFSLKNILHYIRVLFLFLFYFLLLTLNLTVLIKLIGGKEQMWGQEPRDVLWSIKSPALSEELAFILAQLSELCDRRRPSDLSGVPVNPQYREGPDTISQDGPSGAAVPTPGLACPMCPQRSALPSLGNAG